MVHPISAQRSTHGLYSKAVSVQLCDSLLAFGQKQSILRVHPVLTLENYGGGEHGDPAASKPIVVIMQAPQVNAVN